MANAAAHRGVSDFLNRLAHAGHADRPDADLLGDFIDQRDEVAFAALVRRHGSMVLGVCRRILRHAQDAEDAFQATFLVLVRKAASVAPRSLLGNWLYGVACKTARKVAARAARRPAVEGSAARPERMADSTADGRELLDVELGRLPERYRVVVVLIELQGRTLADTATLLGCPVGTVASRLARGREMLAERLRRHGVLASTALGGLSPVVPAALVESTLGAAVSFAAGHVTVIGVLAEGVIMTLSPSPVKAVTAVLILLGALGLGSAGLFGRPAAATLAPVPEPDAQVISARKKLPRVADPSPELRAELAAFDGYRHGNEEKFAELERRADGLLKRFPAADDQARIFATVAHVAAQSRIDQHVPRVRRYARLALSLSRDPIDRGLMYSYLASAAEVDPAEKDFAVRRKRAADELLTGYAELLVQGLPEKAPDLPILGAGKQLGQPTPEETARYEAYLLARREAEWVRAQVERRETLLGQLRWLFKPQPNVHGRTPEGLVELRQLARGYLKDPALVSALMLRVKEE
jgi:RNA polymerase sigma factor (sigma-70 family)